MKVVITSSAQTLADPIDMHFGRAKFFILADTETGRATAHDNAQNLHAAQGAGIQSAQNVIRSGARFVITGGHCGPKAFEVLRVAGVNVYSSDAPSVAEAVRLFRAGELEWVEAADVEGHWA